MKRFEVNHNNKIIKHFSYLHEAIADCIYGEIVTIYDEVEDKYLNCDKYFYKEDLK